MMKELNWVWMLALVLMVVMYILEITILGKRIEFLLGNAMLAIIATILATHTKGEG